MKVRISWNQACYICTFTRFNSKIIISHISIYFQSRNSWLNISINKKFNISENLVWTLFLLMTMMLQIYRLQKLSFVAFCMHNWLFGNEWKGAVIVLRILISCQKQELELKRNRRRIWDGVSVYWNINERRRVDDIKQTFSTIRCMISSFHMSAFGTFSSI